jgi:hypothetical protein
VRLNLDASCNENGPNLSLDPTPYFLVPIIVKCNKLVTMEAQTLFDFGASTCFMDKELVSVTIQVGFRRKEHTNGS